MGDTGFRFGPSMSNGPNLGSSRGRHQSMVRSAYSAGSRMYGSLPQRSTMGAGELMGMADAFSKGHQVVWDWHINADGVLEADEGDNALTLALYMGSSVEEAFYLIFQNQGFRKIKKGDVVTPYLPAVDIVLEEEPPIYGTYMGVPGQLNAKPNTGVLLATAMSEFTANFLTFMASLGTSSTARTADLVIMAARSKVKSAVVEAAKGVNPSSLIRTEVGRTWKTSTRNVAEIMNSAKTQGILKPIDVFVHNGKSYIINGHHRVHAAIRSGQNVPVNYLSSPGNYSNIFELQNAAYKASLSPFKVDSRMLNSLIK
jgi:hypothetical protein